jgi:hypothetical protein
MQGSVLTNPDDLSAEVVVQMRTIALAPFSTYAATAIGYPILGGSLTLDTGVNLQGSSLDSSTDLTFNRFDLSREAVGPTLGVPVHLGISLLKDREDRIQLNRVRVYGDLSAPGVDVRSLIVQAFVRIIGNLAARPFALLGGMLGKSEASLEAVFFAPGSSELGNQAQETVQILEEALFERPSLHLRLIPLVAKNADRLAIAEDLLKREIDLLEESVTYREISNALSTLGWEQSIDDDRFRALFQRVLGIGNREQPGDPYGILAVLYLREFENASADAGQLITPEVAREQLVKAIADGVDEDRITDLTMARLAILKDHFLRGDRIDSSRLIVGEVEVIDEKAPQVRFEIE